MLNDQRSGAATMFHERMRICAEASPENLGDLAAAVTAANQGCSEAFAYLQANPAEAQRHARRLMAMMAESLAAALLLEEASERCAAGDERKAMVARLYIESRLAPRPRRGIGGGSDLMRDCFAALVQDSVATSGREPLPA